MKINSAKFVKGIIGTDNILYDGKFQIAFMGRSNVGKSTIINDLCARNNLVRTSSNPGKTVRMDFFLLNNSFYLVDFPGYGYAKRSEEKREKIAKMILWYLMYSQVKKRLVVLIIDAKVGFTNFDSDILKTLQEHHINYIVVANKADKLKMGQIERQFASLRRLYENIEIIPHSYNQKYAKANLWGRIGERIAV